MKLFIARVLVLASAWLISACASEEVSSTTHHSAAEGTVPGETLTDERQLQPGTGSNPNASVRW
jgi:hypothetical protein